ncbi:transglycosylase domain-containing protein [Pseudalkalibacillus salsuginis]|uniref:transglycosylase domain-containing protein n=1 Tax=Pseudalkalibacillus salsuginis TaxID=2910972 RepID=UPI001F478AF7|nr:transglycosylase domain-containing protein [Pseudalkalibacillus salsuginis]MCF6410980.1 penicillin-binding protein [Pseudalkalibacillus salsuginis]
MKLLAGYIGIISLLLSSFMLTTHAWREIKSVEPPSKMIDSEIPIDSVQLAKSSTILADDGSIIDTIHGTEHRIYIPYEQLPSSVIHAFIAAEDNHFFKHRGVDGTAIIRAIVINAKSNSIDQGGSTITQQLARNLFLSHTKTYKRKLHEAFYSYRLEQELTKEKIFELYSNAIYFGNGIYGIETASRFYFGQSINQLSLSEIALLCGIPNSPIKYDPITNMDRSLERQRYVLRKMFENKYIKEEEYNKAMNSDIVLDVLRPVHEFPDYTSYTLRELKDLVSQSEGFDEKLKNAETTGEKKKIRSELDRFVYQLVYEKGIKIETNLDKGIQINTREQLGQLPYEVEGAFVVIDHTTHKLKALIGGKKMKANEFNRAYQSYRQPGSAIKPLLAFVPIIEQKALPLNVPVDASPFCKQTYCPSNYGNATYRNVSLKEAMGKSINTAAVRMVDSVGIEQAFQFLEPFSFKKVSAKDHRLPTVLGGFDYGLSPLELTNAYTAFSNNGLYQPSRAIKSVHTIDGRLLYQWKDKPRQVWSSDTNEKMRILLSYVMTNGTGRQANIPSKYTGGKTGTTNDNKDLWFVGMTERYTAGIWVGKDRPAPITNVQSRVLHLKIWKDVMKQAGN